MERSAELHVSLLKVGQNASVKLCSAQRSSPALRLIIMMQGANQAAAAGKLDYPTFMLGQVRCPRPACFPVSDGQVECSAPPAVGFLHTCWCCCHGQVGTDVSADLLRSSLEEARVDVSHLRAVEGPTGAAVILLQPSGGALALSTPCQE